MAKIAPSILAANFANLEKDIKAIEKGGADYLHMDVMDGIFVPNISIGIPVVHSIRKVTDIVMDVHLMIERPIRYINDFIEAGADIVVFHLESDLPEKIFETIELVRLRDRKVGLSIKPNTPVEMLYPFMHLIDMVLIMTVEPGFGGQEFISSQLIKIAVLRKYIEEQGLCCEIEVDGGINPETAKLCIDAGADVLVAGSAIFKASDPEEIINKLRGKNG